ncbi:MAG: adenylyl-sulfate kinase, partial [Nannocystaceae bacterium]|nr:adenylyl-sulfate kinase [Nannocystaceae bacterium]
ERDQAGLYEAADKGELANFPGVSFDYEAPTNADLTLDTSSLSVDECVAKVVALLEERGFTT